MLDMATERHRKRVKRRKRERERKRRDWPCGYFATIAVAGAATIYDTT